jgi:hypothetical protein
VTSPGSVPSTYSPIRSAEIVVRAVSHTGWVSSTPQLPPLDNWHLKSREAELVGRSLRRDDLRAFGEGDDRDEPAPARCFRSELELSPGVRPR